MPRACSSPCSARRRHSAARALNSSSGSLSVSVMAQIVPQRSSRSEAPRFFVPMSPARPTVAAGDAHGISGALMAFWRDRIRATRQRMSLVCSPPGDTAWSMDGNGSSRCLRAARTPAEVEKRPHARSDCCVSHDSRDKWRATASFARWLTEMNEYSGRRADLRRARPNDSEHV